MVRIPFTQRPALRKPIEKGNLSCQPHSDDEPHLGNVSSDIESVGMKAAMKYFAFTIALFIAMVDFAVADIFKVDSPDCILRLEGAIEAGDFEKLKRLSELHFPKYTSDELETGKQQLCLNSPGGLINESKLIASYVYEFGIGTVVAENDYCYSACAIVFMMGMARASESEDIYINRKMHYKATIGFHRPYLLINYSISANARDIELAFDLAYNSVMELLIVANQPSPVLQRPMIPSDLLQKMLEHVGDDFFMIDTVDKAGRWKIDVYGYNEKKLLNQEQAYFACQNSMNWNSGQFFEIMIEEIYSGWPEIKNRSDKIERLISGAKLIDESSEGTLYTVNAINMLYSSANCLIYKEKDILERSIIKACGYDDYNFTVVGYGKCDRNNYKEEGFEISYLSTYDPSTKIQDLGE